MEELVFTPSAVLALLTEIEELKGKQISFKEEDDQIVLTIDDSTYSIDSTLAEDLQVDDYTVETLSIANEEGYEELESNEDVTFNEDEPVEGGIIKELVKTLAIGGLVRMTNNALIKDRS